MQLDEHDLKILKIIQEDGRVTKTKLAERIHLSPSPTWERLRRLEEAGIIVGYQAKLDPKKIGPVTTVMVEVLLKRHQYGDFKCFEEAITSYPQVVECLATGGGFDYLLRIIVSDIDTYQRFMDSLLEKDIGIDRYFTYVVTKSIKELSGLPIDSLAEKKL